MTIIDKTVRDLLETTEFVAIATSGSDGPHMVGNWGDYLRKLGVEGDRILLPAGHYHATEQNLRRDPRVAVMVASRQVHGSHGPGQGGVLYGRGEILAEGPLAQRVKDAFPWARGAFVITVERVDVQL